jgi:hypothetical protein
MPLWKVQVPTHIGQRPVPSEPLSSYLARRAEELSLAVSRAAHGSGSRGIRTLLLSA